MNFLSIISSILQRFGKVLVCNFGQRINCNSKSIAITLLWNNSNAFAVYCLRASVGSKFTSSCTYKVGGNLQLCPSLIILLRHRCRCNEPRSCRCYLYYSYSCIIIIKFILTFFCFDIKGRILHLYKVMSAFELSDYLIIRNNVKYTTNLSITCEIFIYCMVENCPSKQSVLHYYKFRQTENILRQNLHLITLWKQGGCVITQRKSQTRRNLKRLTNSLWSFVIPLITFNIVHFPLFHSFLCVCIVAIVAISCLGNLYHTIHQPFGDNIWRNLLAFD